LTIVETINGETTELDSYEISDWEDAGWKTINFTLGSSRAVTVHLDDVLVLEATASSSAIPFVPEFFYFSAIDNVMMDNIEVSDDTDPTTTPTTETTSVTTTTTTDGGTSPPPQPIDTTLLIAGAGVAVVIVVAVVFLKRR
jgi:hypothetical protein